MKSRTGIKVLQVSAALLGFILLILWVDFHGTACFSNQEAMESAQLGRHLAAWKGYVTYSIRPAAIGMLQRADPSHAQDVLNHPVPDLSVAPGYPFVLACLMKILPFNFSANRNHPFSFQPELLINIFNQALFLVAIVLVFLLARWLFDARVAWVSAIVFGGSEVYWNFTVSGLSTMFLLLVFLVLTGCLAMMVRRENLKDVPSAGAPLALAAVAGALLGVGTLSRYSFIWMIFPVLSFIRISCKRHWRKLFLCASASFLLLVGPWLVRNWALSRTPFGTAGYALVENTRPFEGNRVERSFDPFSAGLDRLSPRDTINKFLINERQILLNELPRLGGNWVWAFFLCSLFVPFRDRVLRNLRTFLGWSVLLMAEVQALGQTHLSADSPEINSENLLILLAPVVLIFGTGFFFVLLDGMNLAKSNFRGVVVLFTVAMCAPFFLALASPPDNSFFSPYVPFRIQGTAAMMKPDELMMSDIPWAVAWYGDRPCAWLTLEDSSTFEQMNKLKPVLAIYLTEETTDSPLLSHMLYNPRSWGRFLLNSLPKLDSPQGMTPSGFPLTKAIGGYVPDQLFLSDKVRWNEAPRKLAN